MTTLAAIGDSLTHNITLGVPPSRLWPAALTAQLRRLGLPVQVRNFGRSGSTTALGGTNMLTRFPALLEFDTPALAVLWGGANDPGNSIPTAITRNNLQSLIRGLKFGASGAVAGQASLPAAARPGERQVVLSDTSGTGGVPLPANAPGLPTLGGTATSPTVWECRFGAAGEAGWGRVANASTPATHVSRFIVLSMHYLNYSGGDTLATPYAAYDDATGVRKAQLDAAAAEGAVYGDLYSYLKGRIVSGVEAQNSYSWHVENGNQHLNAHGMSLVAQCVLDAILAQPGWVDALRA